MESKDKKEEQSTKEKNEAWLQYIYETTFNEEDREFLKGYYPERNRMKFQME